MIPFLKLVLTFISFIIYGLLIMFVLVSTTAPFLASILPTAVACEFIVMEVKAICFLEMRYNLNSR